jgi:deoxyadenosine/deoxycytidine kinase
MEQYTFLLEEIKRIQYRLEQLENQKKDNYCENCKRLYERFMYKCENCERNICNYCCIEDNKLLYCPRKCCNRRK